MYPMLELYSRTYLTAMGVDVRRHVAKSDVSEEEFLRQEALRRQRVQAERPSWPVRTRHLLARGVSALRRFEFNAERHGMASWWVGF